jgi:ATP-dependent DNA helicase RecG
LILKYLAADGSISTRELANKVGISQRKIKENIAKLKTIGIIERIGPARGGHWKVNEISANTRK